MPDLSKGLPEASVTGILSLPLKKKKKKKSVLLLTKCMTTVFYCRFRHEQGCPLGPHLSKELQTKKKKKKKLQIFL